MRDSFSNIILEDVLFGDEHIHMLGHDGYHIRFVELLHIPSDNMSDRAWTSAMHRSSLELVDAAAPRGPRVGPSSM